MYKPFLTAFSIVAVTAFPAFPQEFDTQIKARKGMMSLIGLNMGVVGGMAQGKTAWDADLAAAAAESLVGISMVDQAILFPEGSDNFALDGQTRAKPEITDDFAGYMAKWSDFGAAAAELRTAVAAGPDGLGAAVGKVGGTCKGCHETYRGPEN